MNRKDFEKNLILYGSNIDQWPEDIRQDAVAVYESSAELQKLLKEEKLFEQSLKECAIEEPSSNLAHRIITSANKRLVEKDSNTLNNLGQFISEQFIRFLSPKIAMGMALILVIGFLLGYSNPFLNDESTEAELVTFLYDNGDYYEK